MTVHDQITPVALHQLISRLQDDHQRMYPHHAHLCPLCQDTATALDLLAEHMPEEDAGSQNDLFGSQSAEKAAPGS